MPELQPLIDVLPPSSLAVLFAFGLFLHFAFRWLDRAGILTAKSQIKEAKGDGMPVAFIEALRENTQAKKDELAAVKDMAGIIAASNRLAVDQQAGGAKVLETLQGIERSCIEHVGLQRQTAQETRDLSAKVEALAREMARMSR